jgi:nodulation protein E
VAARRVVVTGVGVVSALGHDTEQFWEALRAGRSGIGPIEAVDRTQLRAPNGAEVRGFDPKAHFPDRGADYLDRFAQFALVASREALQNAGLADDRELGDRTAIVTGTCIGGQTSHDQGFVSLYVDKLRTPHPLTIPKTMANAGASQISMELGITGPAYTVSTACASANHAIGLAFWMVRTGLAERALTGGSEAPFSFGMLKAWDAVRVVAPDTCRPFSKDRKGLILGEGGAMMVLEPLEAALARGAPIVAELVGFGMSSDAHHITMPSGDGGARAMQLALEDGGLRPEQVGYVNAHGTGTQANDAIEACIIRRVFGPHADRVPVTSTKSMHGHALGAAGAIEAVATVLALRHGVAPPTANFTEPDPQCDLDVVPNVARPLEAECALSNAFAFGGLNAVLAFRRWGG